MSKYTIELNYLVNSNNFILFDFEYEFYDEKLKEQFEKKFIDHYYFHEIGFETISRFKHFLRMRLNEIAPHYKEYYKTVLAMEDTNFLENKWLTEKSTREIIKEGTENGNINGTTLNNSDTSLNTKTDYQESNLDNGIAELENDKLTNVNTSLEDNKQSTNSSNNINSVSTNATNEKTIESFTFDTHGSIGVVTNATMLEQWRNVIVNIDKEIIEECRDLFMQVF